MSLQTTMTRIAELQSVLAPPAPAAPAATAAAAASGASAAATAAPADPTFARMLGASSVAPTAVAGPLPGGGTGGAALLAAAQGEVGQAEQPPGSNDSPRIAQYRQATAGSGVGPWCAYFTSWAAREAGVPLGDTGQGFGRVDDVYAWAQRTGRANPVSSGAPPAPGDLIVWDEHIGIVERVNPDGSIATIEGNSSDAVTRRTHPAGGALGYVRMS